MGLFSFWGSWIRGFVKFHASPRWSRVKNRGDFWNLDLDFRCCSITLLCYYCVFMNFYITMIHAFDMVWCDIMSCYEMLWYVMICYIMLCYEMSCDDMLCYDNIMLMLHYAMLCYVMLWDLMLYYVEQYDTI